MNRTAAGGNGLLERHRRGRLRRRCDRRLQNRLRDERREAALFHRLAIESGGNDDGDANQRRAWIRLTHDRGAAVTLDNRGGRIIARAPGHGDDDGERERCGEEGARAHDGGPFGATVMSRTVTGAVKYLRTISDTYCGSSARASRR